MNKFQRLFLQDPDAYRAASLSSDQLSLRDFVHQWGSVTSNQIAAAFDVSVPSASTRLKALYDKGYLSRAECPAESGGIEFIYRTAK